MGAALVRASLVLVVAILLVACGQSSDKAGGTPAQKTRVLRLAFGPGDESEVIGFAEEVRRRTNGRLRIDVVTHWRYGIVDSEQKTIGDVRAGRVALAAVGSRAWDSLGVRAFRPLAAPFLVDSYPLQSAILRSGLLRTPLERLRALGVEGLGVLPGQLRRVLGLERPIVGAADYRDLRFGLAQSVVGSAGLRALGATPIWFAGGSPIDGFGAIEQPVSFIAGNRYDLEASYLTANLALWARPLVVFANERLFARLDASERRALRQAALAVVPATTRGIVGVERTDAATICARRHLRLVFATAADQESLHRAVAPVYRGLSRDPQTRRLFHGIQALRRSLGPTVSAVPSCALLRPMPGLSASGPLDGLYSLTVAPAELPAASRAAEQYGTWEIVLDRGVLRLTHRSDAADWIADGSVRLSGRAMTWRVYEASDWVPHGTPGGVPVAAGDVLRFRWKRSGAGLTLAPVGGTAAQLPSLLVRPLRRIGDAPGQQPVENAARLEGRWGGKATAADVFAHGGDASAVADNTGPMTFTLHGSRCRWTERTPNGASWYAGMCRFAGDTIEFDVEQTDAGTPPGGLLREFYRWSLFHGRLTFRSTPGFSAEQWTYHPWRRTS